MTQQSLRKQQMKMDLGVCGNIPSPPKHKKRIIAALDKKMWETCKRQVVKAKSKEPKKRRRKKKCLNKRRKSEKDKIKSGRVQWRKALPMCSSVYTYTL